MQSRRDASIDVALARGTARAYRQHVELDLAVVGRKPMLDAWGDGRGVGLPCRRCCLWCSTGKSSSGLTAGACTLMGAWGRGGRFWVIEVDGGTRGGRNSRRTC